MLRILRVEIDFQSKEARNLRMFQCPVSLMLRILRVEIDFQSKEARDLRMFLCLEAVRRAQTYAIYVCFRRQI